MLAVCLVAGFVRVHGALQTQARSYELAFSCQQYVCTPGKGDYGLFCVVCTSRMAEKNTEKGTLQSEQPFLSMGS